MSKERKAKTNLSHYRIISKLGEGGMGEVYLAEDRGLRRKVALKFLSAQFTSDFERLARFKLEAQAASALNHPNILTVYETGLENGVHFIATEFIDGQTLRDRLQTKELSIEDALNISTQTASALSLAHHAGIIHRDIKPENIMIRHDGLVKVLDFGLAKLSSAKSSEVEPEAETQAHIKTQTGIVMGTAAYMSPEQARGKETDSRTDIWSLGCVLYEMLTRQHPFQGETITDVLANIIYRQPSSLFTYRQGIPEDLEGIIIKMLCKNESERYQTAEVLLADLKKLQMHLLVEAEIERTSAANREAAKTQVFEVQATADIESRIARDRAILVGRDAERSQLLQMLKTAKEERGNLVLVTGEPGMGKTTLVEDFLTELTAEGHVSIARGRCSERLAGTEAYLPLLEALESLLHSDNKIAQMMKQVAPTWYAQVIPPSVDSEESARLLSEVKAASQERMKRELVSFLQSVARERPLILFFDDLHWADVSTIDLLNFLAGKFDVMRVLIVATYRPSDMLLAKHPFLQIKPDLQARGVCRELQLEFLNEAEITEYLELEFTGHRFPTEFSQLIHAKTEGSPLFMADLVRYLRDRDVVAQTSGAWKLEQALPDIERELPESVRGMIERKIAQLTEEDHKLLTVASVQGYEFDSAVVAQVLNLDADEIEERLDKLERVFAFVKLASEEEFPNRTLTLRYRFVHVLYQNALLTSLKATRKAKLSRSVAEALEGFYGERTTSVTNELALLWEAAREYVQAAHYFLGAARNAAQVNAHREAVQLAERGLEALLKVPETPERNERELGLQLALGFSLMSIKSWTAPETGAAFDRARQLCEQIGDDPRIFGALVGVWAYHIPRAQYETAHGLCEQMLQLAEQSREPALLVMASMCQAKLYYFQGDLISARQLAERALALDRRKYHDAYLSVYNEDGGLSARREHSFCLWILGYPDRARALAYELVRLAEGTSHPFSVGAAHHTTGVVLSMLRDLQSSQKEFEKVLALGEEHALGDILKHATVANVLNLAYQEPTEEALERAKHAIESLSAQGVMVAATGKLARMGEAFWKAGRCAEGLAAIAEASELVERTGERVSEAEIWRVKGELLLSAAASNSQAEAESCYHQSIKIARQQSAKSWELRAAMSLARLWRQQGKQVEARQMLAEIYEWFTEGFETTDLKEARALLGEFSS